ncbi:MAG: DsbA family oxidoreductase [Alphaproteobacteria bacterium]|nr:DsbA family oxidoreductase [Alphaproteobacteria bacterium]
MAEPVNKEGRPLLVEMIADLACPWCYLGLVRLDKARALRPTVQIDLRWWPYMLNPQLPKEGMDRRTYLRAKFGGDAKASAIYQRIEQAGQDDGLAFAFDKIRRTPNTVSAQRLILLAQDRGQGEAVIRALFKGFFEDGIDIGDNAALARLGEVAGIAQDDITALFAGDAHSADIIRGHQRAQMMGVQGVPVFVVERQHVISGAQAPEVLAGLLDVASSSAVA